MQAAVLPQRHLHVHGFSQASIPQRRKCWRSQRLTVSAAAAVEASPATSSETTQDPLLLRAVRGDQVERPPVWMMRQAGRYMKVYQDLCKKHPTFRERSENADLAVEISLQPWRAFKPDGVILFSDILTPLTGMGIPFDIEAGRGPVIHEPIRTMQQVEQIRKLDAHGSVPYVAEALTRLREEVGHQSTVLGFVGAPFTLATYIVEGGSSKNYTHMKRLMFTQPEVLHAFLSKMADNIADYVRYQADAGAQAVQIFDSWASNLAPQDYDVFAGPYINQIVDSVKKTHPDLPLILYISGSGGLLERMAKCNVEVISVDGSVDMKDAIRRIGPNFAVQGNMDPGVLFGSQETIAQRVVDTVRSAQGTRHIMNLGHGVLVGTPEDSVAHFFEVGKTVNERL
ncbi:Uroporphyrinogen decarboxylase 1, chloroplastic [Trebouxia sp. C0010 RCD-2024]